MNPLALPIASELQRRSIRRVVHFHCDHFEPYRNDASGVLIAEEHVASWLRCTQELAHARNASVFFSSHAHPVVPNSALEQRIAHGIKLHVAPNEVIAFGDGLHAASEINVLGQLVAAKRDFHVHVHHEHWTSSDVSKIPRDDELDAQRLDYYLGLVLTHYRRRTGLALDDWAFVHGCWALNASDRTICNITREVELLLKHGCVADFSFPAGRAHCDPSWKEPHTVLPVNAARGYDTPAASPHRVGTLGAFSPGRMLVWSARTATAYLSLDTLALSGTPRESAYYWIEGAPVIDGTAYVKTHAHSMWWERWRGPIDTDTPLVTPRVCAAFALLEDACAQEHVALEYVTVREALALLRGAA